MEACGFHIPREAHRQSQVAPTSHLENDVCRHATPPSVPMEYTPPPPALCMALLQVQGLQGDLKRLEDTNNRLLADNVALRGQVTAEQEAKGALQTQTQELQEQVRGAWCAGSGAVVLPSAGPGAVSLANAAGFHGW